MHWMTYIRTAAALALTAATAWAGPALACRTWTITQGSAFEALEPLRQASMKADDSRADREAALKKMAELHAAIRPGDSLSLLRAGYWTAVMHDIGVTDRADGPALIERAAAMRPAAARSDDPEYRFFAALAHVGRDYAKYREFWLRALALAKPGSAVAANLRDFEPEVCTRG